MKSRHFVLFFWILVGGLPLRAGFGADSNALRFSSGDLIFLDLDCGELCGAIENVTRARFPAAGSFSHVGILERDFEGKSWVYEAGDPLGVVRTPLSEVLKRVKQGENQPGGFEIGRFKESFRSHALSALRYAPLFLKRAYDYTFTWESPNLYCSKFIYKLSELAGQGRALFNPAPMWFGAEGSPERIFWNQYFASRGLKPPDGKLGINPQSIYVQGKAHFFQ